MPTRFRRSARSRIRRGVATLGLLAFAVTGLTALSSGTASAAAAPGLKIGTWNTGMQPWLPGQQNVIDTIAATDLDVLGLQNVWTESAKTAILADPRITKKYKYSYYAPAAQAVGGCSSLLVPADQQSDFINSVGEAGIPANTYEQPATPVPLRTKTLELTISLNSQPCLSALVNTLQELSPDGDAPLAAVDLAASFNAPFYAHGGSPGQLILSNQPIKDVKVTSYVTNQIRRVNLYATVAGLRIGFTEWPLNQLEASNPDLASYQTGALQKDYAMDVVNESPDVLVGSVNSSPAFQPDGMDVLLQNGFAPTFDQPTYCPSPSHDAFGTCPIRAGYDDGVPASAALDNIYTGVSASCLTPATFATNPTSDHIGLAATCAKAPASTLRADLQVTVAAPASVARNTTFTATVTVRNVGPNPATTLRSTISPGRGITVTSAPGGTMRKGYVVYPAPRLASGASLVYTLTLQTGDKAVDRSGLLATALSAVRDPKYATNVATVPIVIT